MITQASNVPSWVYPTIMFGLLLVAGVAEYLKMIQPGTFGYILTLVIGLISPSPFSLQHTHATDATSQNGNMLPSTTTTAVKESS